jgi:hypothetical protein
MSIAHNSWVRPYLSPLSLVLSFDRTLKQAANAMSENVDFYGYLPSKAAALFGIAYFGVAAITCVLQIVLGRCRHYWMFTVALAGVGETIGWGARLWAHSSVS